MRKTSLSLRAEGSGKIHIMLFSSTFRHSFLSRTSRPFQTQYRFMTQSILAPASKFKLALIQLGGSADKQANLAKARAQVLEAAKNGANVVVLPVM